MYLKLELMLSPNPQILPTYCLFKHEQLYFVICKEIQRCIYVCIITFILTKVIHYILGGIL